MERCPTCGVTGPGATICEGYCSPACWPSAQAEAAARKAAEAARKTEATRRDRTKRKRRVRSSRFATLNAFVDATLAELTGAETKVWLTLFRDTKAEGTARTGQADIARRAGLTVRGVRKAIQKLKAKGLLEIAYRGRLNQGPSCYRIRAVTS
jgi:CRP-like cAMP-binding protein